MSTELKIGTKAPAFSLPDDAGKKISLGDFKGRIGGGIVYNDDLNIRQVYDCIQT